MHTASTATEPRTDASVGEDAEPMTSVVASSAPAESAMPSTSLSDAGRWAVVDYIRTLKAKP